MSTGSELLADHHERLDGWKAISHFLGRGVRTAQRWERALELPVRRLRGEGRSPVFAFCGELRRWMENAAPGGGGAGREGRQKAEGPRTLRGWKEIAGYLGVSVSTAQRYTKLQGLPVEYLPGVRVPVAYPERMLHWQQGAGPDEALPPGCASCMRCTLQTLLDSVSACAAVLEPPSSVVAMSARFRSFLAASNVRVEHGDRVARDFVHLMEPLLEGSPEGPDGLGDGLQEIVREAKSEFQVALGERVGGDALRLRFRRTTILGRPYIVVQCGSEAGG